MHYPLVAFFDQKHFLVENRAPESIYFLTPNRQYKIYKCEYLYGFGSKDTDKHKEGTIHAIHATQRD